MQQLVEAARDGDEIAFDQLARLVGDRCMAIACAILRDPDLAQDAVQTALIATWRRLPTLRDSSRFDAWLHRILVRACYEESNRRRRSVATIRLLPLAAGRESDGVGPIDDRDELARAFDRLTLDQRAALFFHHYLGLSAPEVAGRLGISLAAAKARIHHATSAMRASIEADARTTLRKERPA